jgi:hypothetical protein
MKYLFLHKILFDFLMQLNRHKKIFIFLLLLFFIRVIELLIFQPFQTKA